MTSGSLYINRDPGFDWLGALEYGRVSDGQPPSCWRPIDERFAYFYPPRARRPRGFFIRGFDDFDPFAPECEAIWDRPRFSVPLLGLPAATAGEIVVAARAHLGDEPSVNRAYFNAAMHTSGEEALTLWRCCLESGDSMAHFAIGYTLYELGRFRESYAHLRHYAEIAPHGSWIWCWLGKAAAAIGETAEAERAYSRAIELTKRGDDETDAPELLAQLSAGRASDAPEDDIPF